MSGWYYKLFGMEVGPESIETLVELIKNQTLSRNDEVRFGEKGNWRRIRSIGPLMTHLPFVAAEELAAERAGQSDAAGDAPSGTDFLDVDFLEPDSQTNQAPTNLPVDFSDILNAAETAPVVKSPETERLWWCRIDGKDYGPLRLPQLIEWASTGRLKREDQIRYDQDPYARADTLPSLFPEPSPPTVTETKPDRAISRPTPIPAVKKAPVTDVVPQSVADKPITVAKPAATPATAAPSATVTQPVPVAATRPAVQKPPVTTPLSQPILPTPIQGSPAAKPASETAPSRPSPSSAVAITASASSAANTGASRPAAPVYRPPKIGSGGGGQLLRKLLPVGMGVGGIAIIGALVYFGFQFVPASTGFAPVSTGFASVGTGDEIKRFKALQDGYNEILKLRVTGAKPSENEIKAAQEKALAASKSVLEELKKIEKKNQHQSRIYVLAMKLERVATDKFTDKPTKNESDVGLLSSALVASLGIAK